MDIRILRYFLAVAKEETINSASEYLEISQPTLSRQLMDLEKELNTKLFIRGGRKVTLTDEGLFLKKRAEEIVELLDKTYSVFNSSEDIISGDIHIGCGESEVMRYIFKIIRSMKKEYPEIKYHIASGNAYDVTERLDKGLLDFGVLIEPYDVSKYEYIRLPSKDIWGLLMRTDSPLANKKNIKPADLIGIPILASRQSIADTKIEGWFTKDINKLDIVATYNLLFNASLLVEEGLGYALSIDKIINTTGSSKLCFKPLYPELSSNLSIVWKKYQVFSKASQKFLEYIQKEFN